MIDLQSALRTYIPSLFEVLEDEQISWVRISQVFEQKHQERIARMAPDQETMQVEASFYDVISASLKGHAQALRQLDFFDKLFQEIGMRLTSDQKKHLKTTVFNVLISTDHSYLHYFGELAILNQALKSGNYIFNQTEFKIGNGNSADFYFHDIKNNRPVLVEVVNIVLTKEIKGEDQDIKKFLTRRMTDKINKKSKGRTEILVFELIPVIWGPSKDLQRLSEFYIRGNTVDVPHCLEACAYSSFTFLENRCIHSFGTLSTLFNQTITTAIS